MPKSHHLVCKSCGATDVTVEPPYYRCNYCKSQYRLPDDSELKKEAVVWYRRYRRILTILLVAIATLTAVVIYNTLLLQSTVKLKSVEVEKSVKRPKSTFKNRVFSTDTLKSIYDLKRTSRGAYLIGGVSTFNHILVAEISKEGKVLFARRLSKGFYVSLAQRSEGGTIASYFEMMQKGNTDYLDAKFRVIRQIPEGFREITGYKDGFIGVRDGWIVRYDSEARQVWRKQVDSNKIISKSGAHRDANGKMVPYSRAFDALDLRKVIQLKNGNFVAVGKYKRSQLAVVIFSPNGKIIRYKKLDLGRIYPDALYPSKDGGFIVMARSGIRWLIFNSDGDLIEKKRIDRNRSSGLYGYAIAEDKDGYIVTYMDKGTMIIARVSRDFSHITRHRYSIPNLRLHPQKIISAFGGGFLMAVNTEVHEPWLVKVDSDARLNADLNDPTKDRDESKESPSVPILPPHSGRDIFPTQDSIKLQTTKTTISKTISTVTFLGDRVYDMAVSLDKKYIYAATGATGFRIFTLTNRGTPKLLSNTLRTKSELIVTPNRISIKGGIPPHGTPEYYDHATQMIVNRNQSRAYVCDIEHGFYVVDISDKAHPKIILTLDKVKSWAFALSKDEHTLYFYDGKIHSLSVDKLEEYKDKNIGTYSSTKNMALLYDGAYLAIPDKKEVLIYDTLKGYIVQRYAIPYNSYTDKVYADSDNNIYISVNYNGIEKVHLERDGRLRFVKQYRVESRIYDLTVIPKSHKLCYASDKGAICIDTSKKSLYDLNKTIYRDEGMNSVSSMIMLPDSNTLYIAFTTLSIGYVEIKP